MNGNRPSRLAIWDSGSLRGVCVVAAALLTLGGCLLPVKSKRQQPVATTEVEGIALPGPKAAAPAKPADNSPCMVCHMDFAEEAISAKHAEAGYGCAFCHGESAAHGGDELNVTPPDVLLGRSEIDLFCKTCHPTHETGADCDAFLEKWRGKRRPNGRMIIPESVCTDCHGNHAILTPDQLGQLAPEGV